MNRWNANSRSRGFPSFDTQQTETEGGITQQHASTAEYIEGDEFVVIADDVAIQCQEKCIFYYLCEVP